LDSEQPAGETIELDCAQNGTTKMPNEGDKSKNTRRKIEIMKETSADNLLKVQWENEATGENGVKRTQGRKIGEEVHKDREQIVDV